MHDYHAGGRVAIYARNATLGERTRPSALDDTPGQTQENAHAHKDHRRQRRRSRSTAGGRPKQRQETYSKRTDRHRGRKLRRRHLLRRHHPLRLRHRQPRRNPSTNNVGRNNREAGRTIATTSERCRSGRTTPTAAESKRASPQLSQTRTYTLAMKSAPTCSRRVRLCAKGTTPQAST